MQYRTEMNRVVAPCTAMGKIQSKVRATGYTVEVNTEEQAQGTSQKKTREKRYGRTIGNNIKANMKQGKNFKKWIC
jgi:hypothetical protein